MTKDGKRKATVADMVKLPDAWKVKLWNEHAEQILEACEFHWDSTPTPEPKRKNNRKTARYTAKMKQLKTISQHCNEWLKAGLCSEQMKHLAFVQYNVERKMWEMQSDD
tara:strand:+ start:256 stop:582 length:327 start_codon:yes stop_codon:yes gene_type:complete